jgi:hypothetical protein
MSTRTSRRMSSEPPLIFNSRRGNPALSCECLSACPARPEKPSPGL